MKLTENFSLKEMTQSQTALKNNIGVQKFYNLFFSKILLKD